MKKQSLAIFAVSLLVGILAPQKAEGQAFGRILNQAKKAVKERVEGAVKREKIIGTGRKTRCAETLG
ncbi:hypothetical protein [Hoylesella saccharolytica]|uniref:hypothetical protein n=1 Tax=Hoylesella saccharolytica TaxID=633701 RepID=UPI0028D2BD2B|nr:hypothetical protein [Hoylesella saccharolytica]